MFLSVFDVFKIGIGPSSSHTMGPMSAANRFLELILSDDWPRPVGATVAAIRMSLHGSLAYTGVGHGSDRVGVCLRSASADLLRTLQPGLGPGAGWEVPDGEEPSRHTGGESDHRHPELAGGSDIAAAHSQVKHGVSEVLSSEF